MLQDWIVNEMFLNKETALGNPAVDGFFVDDCESPPPPPSPLRV
jgi:hypothetical protein